MKISWFKRVISPEVGAYLAGYSIYDRSVSKLDDLYMTGLCMADGESRALLVSFDLLGLDGWYIRKLRKNCAELLGIAESAVLLTCTHTHSGPETRSLAANPDQLNRKYLDDLAQWLAEEVRNLKEFRECTVTYYSSWCDENRNRRYITADNHGSFTPHRREVIPVATGYADKEFGEMCFFDTASSQPLYLIGNYAAHPLAGHSPGTGGRRISADFPGAFRNYVTANTGAECMFISGAAGDLVPKEDELGDDAIRQTGIRLGKAAIGGIIDSRRNPGRFCIPDPKIGSCIRTFTVPLRKKYRNHPDRLPAEYLNMDEVTLEIQCLAIGDICLVGVPGEVCCELGQEIKWHSPFRRTFIAYNSTAYFSYIGHANMLVTGSYEANSQRFSARGGLILLQTASDAMFELREKLFPSGDEPYPDGVETPLVDIPPNR